jgi:exopolysaccharide biosynthesis polyprenyl glycosylphosphotransferase
VLAFMGMAFVSAGIFYYGVSAPPGMVPVMAHTAAIYFPLLLVGRLGFRAVLSIPRLSQRVLIIGTSDLGVAIARAIRERRNLGTELVGYLSDELVHDHAVVEGVPVLGKVHEIEKVIDHKGVSVVVVASKSRSEYFPADQLLLAKLRGVRVESGVSFFESVTGRVYLRELRPSYLIFSDGFRSTRTHAFVKRAIDVTAAGIGLLVAGPVLALCAGAIRAETAGPILYRQTRLGEDGKPFNLIKLRSMTHKAEAQTGPVWSERRDDRITKVGLLLRRTRLDELPQLLNVLKGEMSLVGPRPERPEFVDALSERYPYFRLRCAVKPGLTGWAQIRHGYTNDVEGVEEKLAYDLYYLKHRSLIVDFLILWKTIKTVILFQGV